MISPEVLARFEQKYMPEPMSGCWLWVAGVISQKRPYGLFWYNGRQMVAHRASWMMHFGDIPAGLLVCHKCDTYSCVNPTHLFLGTERDNSLDAAKKGRIKTILKPADIATIRRSVFSDGLTRKDVAKLFGISRGIIERICSGELWAHVPDEIFVDDASLRTIKQRLASNLRDINARKTNNTHCRKGHEYTSKNTAISHGYARRCRECSRLQCKRRRAKHGGPRR